MLCIKQCSQQHMLGSRALLLKSNVLLSTENVSYLQSLAAGELQESPSSTGAVAAANGNAAAVAVTAAAAAMAAGPERVSVDLLLSSGSLRWLLGQDAAAGLAVLEARQDLNPQEVMKLLEGVQVWMKVHSCAIFAMLYPVMSVPTAIQHCLIVVHWLA